LNGVIGLVVGGFDLAAGLKARAARGSDRWSSGAPAEEMHESRVPTWSRCSPKRSP